MVSLPSGTVTFLFTDIEGSTRLLEQLGTDYAQVLAEYRGLLRSAFQERSGQEVDAQGDALFVAFARAKDALSAAVAGQRTLTAHLWPRGASLRVRMALHTGEPIRTQAGYVGMDVHLAARVCAAAHGGQILLSQTTRDLVEDDLPQDISLRSLGKHRLKDLTRPQSLFQVTVADLPADFPPLRSLGSFPNNLPMQLTSFIGREREQDEVRRLLLMTRLLTLTGAGGAGKTRLALQVGADLVEEYPDGTWLVELGALSDPDLVPQTVASMLGVREQPGQPMLLTLTAYLGDKHLLLLLDNCEHLVSACARLADTILKACPRVRILATSREGLAITGESIYPVPSLSLPEPHHMPPVETLMQYEAVRLFVDRSAAVLPTFRVTAEDARSVVQVCYRLDGIPLAIELAAARTKALSVKQILALLDETFRLLTGGSRTALPRHQTLRAAMDWSYDLLSERERVAFRRLAVFAGGFTLEAARGVVAGEGVESSEVVDLLTQLVAKSFVVFAERTITARYRLLEIVRQYARNRLVEAAEAPSVRERHCALYLRLAEEAASHQMGADSVTWLNSLEIEHDNLRAALDWSLEGGDPEAGLRLAANLGWFWEIRGYLTEGRERFKSGLSQESAGPIVIRAKALHWAGMLAFAQSDYAHASTLLEEAIDLSRQLKDERSLAWSMHSLASMAYYQDLYERVTTLAEECLALFRDFGDDPGIAASLQLLGRVAWRRGNYARATALGEESLMLCHTGNVKRGVSTALDLLALVALHQGNYARAAGFMHQSLALYRELGEKNPDSWNIFGFILLGQGEIDQATAFFEKGLTLARELGYKRGIAHSLRALGEVALRQADYSRARTLLIESLRLFREQQEKFFIAWCLERLAMVDVGAGHRMRAARLCAAAGSLRTTLGAPLSPADRDEYEHTVASLRAGLDEDELSTAWAEGHTMTLEEVIDRTLRDAN